MSDDDRPVCALDGCDRKLPTDSPSTVCTRCLNRLERNLGDITSLAHELEVTITRQNVTSTGGGRVTGERPLAYNAEASDRADNLHRTLAAWVAVARAATHSPEQALGGMTTPRLGHALLCALPGLIKRDDITDLIDEVTYAIRKARQIIDKAPDRWYVGTCDHVEHLEACDDDLCESTDHEVECGAELYAIAGHDTVVCRTCSTEHNVPERRLAMLLEADDELMTLTQLTTAVGLTGAETITRKSLEGWVRRGRLIRAGNNGATATYRVGDVLDIIRSDARKATTP